MKPVSRWQRRTFAVLGVLGLALGTAYAPTPTSQPATASSPNSPIIFPAQGQTQEQMEKDKADCYTWAKQQSGYDPMAAGLQTQQPQQPPPSNQRVPSQPSGGVVRGGAKGAAAGAALGAIAGNAGKGAAIGAASGGAIGGVRQRRQGIAQQQATAQQQADQQHTVAQQQATDQQKIDAYKRAFTACMEGKGYTVK